jgi:hypothetical protein
MSSGPRRSLMAEGRACFRAMAVGGCHEYAVLSGSNIIDGNRSEFSLATGPLTRG